MESLENLIMNIENNNKNNNQYTLRLIEKKQDILDLARLSNKNYQIIYNLVKTLNLGSKFLVQTVDQYSNSLVSIYPIPECFFKMNLVIIVGSWTE